MRMYKKCLRVSVYRTALFISGMLIVLFLCLCVCVFLEATPQYRVIQYWL